MSKQENKQQYLDFDQYIRQGEPAQKERAEAWRVAIGLQAVDGLNTSEYLHQTARKNIEGDITIDEARELQGFLLRGETVLAFLSGGSLTPLSKTENMQV